VPVPVPVPMMSCKNVWIWVNDLQGTLPRELFWLASLKSLSLFENTQLSGSHPSEIGLMSDLEAVAFSWSSLTGQMPTEIGQLSHLAFLAIKGNRCVDPERLAHNGLVCQSSINQFALHMFNLVDCQGLCPLS